MLCSLGFLPGNCVDSCLDAIRLLYDFYMVEKNKPIKSMSVWRKMDFCVTLQQEVEELDILNLALIQTIPVSVCGFNLCETF